MQLQAVNPFFPAATWRPQVAAAAARVEGPTESVELSTPEPPSSRSLQATGRRSATVVAGPLLGALGRAAGGSCPYMQKVGVFELARTVATNLDNPHRVIQQLHDRHGKTLQVDLPGQKPIVFDSRPEVMHQILAGTRSKKGVGVWEKSERLAVGFRPTFGQHNVFTGTGPEWRASRELLEPPMRGAAIHTEENIRHIGEVFDRHLAGVSEGEVDLRALTQRAAMDSAFQVMFGARLSSSELDETLAAFATVRSSIVAGTLAPDPAAPGLAEANRKLNALADRMIAVPQQDNALAALQSSGFAPERVRDEVLTLMLAGHETTASLLSWAVLEMAHNPGEQKHLQASLEGLQGSLPTLSTIQRATTGVKSVMMETMRLHSPAYLVARVAEEDTTVADLSLAMGTTVVMSPLESHRDQDAWGADADQFRPGRFKGSTSKLFGFGGGTRLCLGQNLARLESTLFLTRFFQRFEVEPVSDLTATSDVSHHPKDARVRVRLREKDSWGNCEVSSSGPV